MAAIKESKMFIVELTPGEMKVLQKMFTDLDTDWFELSDKEEEVADALIKMFSKFSAAE